MEKNLPGVYTAKKKDSSIYYRASVTFRTKHISLGSYDTAFEAHLSYKEALRLLEETSVSLDNYTKSSPLAFGKWVSILNFRDNGIYFATPIYMRKKFFNYYLSQAYVLKFDIDDLFYYSTRKIMRRGGHLFVSDYGMQVNILNRYGIKNYAVLNKDYRFINDDPTDFRYENIEIINRFQGLTLIHAKDALRYKVHIHIRSSYVVGTYPTETEAAIAYNKAVDILKKNGIDRNYSLNYIEGLSPAAYADIYSALRISPVIYKLTPENT